ncbi:uncharacterized protein LOC115370202 isoform X2 [Myripristis murdjan]|uniref:uncharacterized protein LOC115365391 isoform X2 n=1 Tax=Myripristis murdjan TaxID=586833 RepID=UPI001175DB43|nr:uncharacterized protein LOC115365391 isoform X2 [Myripristis murdjan]XP_029922984.1 uncharacterized protein LOC115370202 isoform X2 [Myripristis murdjan]
MNDTVKFKQKRRVQTAASALIPFRGQASQRCSEVVNRMIIDDVSVQVKNDPLICEFGDRLLEKHGSDRSKDAYVSQKMRELGRFVQAAKSIDCKVKMLQDVLVPPKFSLAVQAAKKAAGFIKSNHRYDTPSLALKLGHSLKAACEIVIAQHVKAEDESAAGRVRNFLGLVATEWDFYVSCRARTNLEEGKWNKKEMIPLTEDVMKLHKVLKSTEEKAKEQLLEGPNPAAYKTLSECLLSQIILFNRRRQGEAAKILLQTYRNRSNEVPNEDIMQCLSKLEQDLSHEFTRLVIRGKRGHKVPVLLTKEMTNSLDFLIDRRSEDNGILESNEYVFARQNSKSYLRGSDCLRKYAAASEAKRPETLRSTQLRKHVATLSQIMNLKDNELDQLAKFMGHDIRVHREYYRLTENTLQLAKMSKLLMAIELGTDTYKGKSLDEIDFGLETLSSSVGAVQEPQISQSEKSSEQGPRKRKKRRKVSEPAQDSDEEPQRTSTPVRPKVLKKTKKTEEPQRTSTPVRPKVLKKTKKTAKKSKRVSEPAQDSDEAAETRTSCAGPSAQRTNKTGTDCLIPTASKRKSWSKAEKSAVWRQLGQYITLRRVPGKEPCLKALKAEPVLKNRNWKDIKNQVYNSITAQKRKSI